MSLQSKTKTQWSSFPHGTVPLFFIQIVATLSYSVLYSTLVLYMKNKLLLPVNTANSIMGVFIALNFALHLLGGIWGGRLMSYRLLFCIGMAAQIIGCILLSINTTYFLYYGLATFLTGSGLNVTCLNCMLTQRFTPQDNQRETAFLLNYAGMNLGFFIGFSLSGIFQITQNYPRLFLLSSIGNLIAIFICIFCWQQLKDKHTAYIKKTTLQKRHSIYLGISLIFLLPLVLSQLLHYAVWANKLIMGIGCIMLALIFYIANQQKSLEAKNKMRAFAVLMTSSIVFWTLYQIGPMGLTVFIDQNVQRFFGEWIIPPQWFQNVNTITIVIGGPVLSKIFESLRIRNISISIPLQFSLALGLIGLSFIILPLGIFFADASGMVSPAWVILSFVLQSVGELLISPIGYAMIGRLAPASFQGVMMGMWMLGSGVGATLSSYSSNWMLVGQKNHLPVLTNPGFSHVFLVLGLIAIFASFVMFMLIPKLTVLISEKKGISINDEHFELTKGTETI